MNFGEIIWVLEAGTTDVTSRLAALADAGLSPENHLGERMCLDEEGNRVPRDDDQIRSAWESNSTSTVQFWISRESDVIVILDPTKNAFDFFLEGLTENEARLTIFAAINAATRDDRTIALVSDEKIEDYEDAWFAYIGGVNSAAPHEPDLLLKRRARQGEFELKINPQSWLHGTNI